MAVTGEFQDNVAVEADTPAVTKVDVVVKENKTHVVEVLKGRPGVQNLYVSYEPPANPEEGWVWIDLNEQ